MAPRFPSARDPAPASGAVPGIDATMRAEIIAVAEALADIARPVTLRYFRHPDLATDSKGVGGFDPVTEADRAAEQAMRAALSRLRPADGIAGEEFGTTPGTSGLTWVLDPIDGTRGYLSGTPTWGVLIAAVLACRPIYGIIDQPYIGERFRGGLGQARMTGPAGETSLRSRTPRPLAEAVLFTTFPEIGTPEERAAFDRLSSGVRLTRFGMDCYAYALLAAGQIDLVVEAGLHPHDIAAPIAVIEAAGGIVTTWDGGPASGGGQVIAAANAEIHAAAMARLLDG